MQEEDLKEITKTGYGSDYFKEFQLAVNITDEICQEILQSQKLMNYPELWFFRQLFYKCIQSYQPNVFAEYYSDYNNWFLFEKAVEFDVGAIDKIDNWKRLQIDEKRPILWLMRLIYSQLLNTPKKLQEFNKYEPAFKKWLDFEVSISPSQQQLDQIDVLENNLEQDGEYAVFMNALIDQQILNERQAVMLKKTYPQWFPKTPRMPPSDTAQAILTFFCAAPEEAKTPTPKAKRKRSSSSVGKRSRQEEEYLDVDHEDDPEDFIEENGSVVALAVTTRRKQSSASNDSSSDKKLDGEFKVKMVKLDADLSRFGKERLTKIPGLICNDALVEWKNSQAEFATKAERDLMYDDICKVTAMLGDVIPKNVIIKTGQCGLYANVETLERVYSNFILIDILQDKKDMTTQLILVFSAIATESQKSLYTWQLMQFCQMSYADQYATLVDGVRRGNSKNGNFYKFLLGFSANFAKALISQEPLLSNLIIHFASFKKSEQATFLENIDRLLEECPVNITPDIKEYLTNLLELTHKKLLTNQDFAACLYARYLMASEPVLKMHYLRELDAKCINRDYLLNTGANFNPR